MWNELKKFDAYPKLLEEVRVRTLSGGFGQRDHDHHISIVIVVIIFIVGQCSLVDCSAHIVCACVVIEIVYFCISPKVCVLCTIRIETYLGVDRARRMSSVLPF
jgi:hypothetical protein